MNFLTLKSSKNSIIFVFNKLIIEYPQLKHLKKKRKRYLCRKKRLGKKEQLLTYCLLIKSYLAPYFWSYLRESSDSFFLKNNFKFKLEEFLFFLESFFYKKKKGANIQNESIKNC
jgi:hypothetical protein